MTTPQSYSRSLSISPLCTLVVVVGIGRFIGSEGLDAGGIVGLVSSRRLGHVTILGILYSCSMHVALARRKREHRFRAGQMGETTDEIADIA